MGKAVNNIERAIQLVAREYEKERLSNYLLHLFLPLEIDMQALEILWKENKKEKAVDYLREMLTDTKDDEFYQNKFTKAQILINDVHDGNLKNKIQDKNLLGKEKTKNDSLLHNLLMCIDDLREKTKNSNLEEKDVKNLLGLFNSSSYHSFHDWYCALASCLRGEEACK